MPPRADDWPIPIQTLGASHAHWPAGLAALDRAPPQLRVLGSLDRWAPGGATAVVGTRYADPDALAFARQLGGDLAEAGQVVVSGGARGIDAAAHRGALEAGGRTVVVLASGLSNPYPRENLPLFQEIVASGGALVSEAADDWAPRRGLFLARNRLIAALADRVVVAQAPRKSGAMSTAAWAEKLKRPLYAVPYAPWEVRGEGCLSLLFGGARICTSVRDVLSVRPLGPEPEPQRGRGNGKNRFDYEGLGDDGEAVLSRLGPRPRHVDQLVTELGWPVQRVQRALLRLTLAGRASRESNGAYVESVHSHDHEHGTSKARSS